jgi:hypothetical protein
MPTLIHMQIDFKLWSMLALRLKIENLIEEQVSLI